MSVSEGAEAELQTQTGTSSGTCWAVCFGPAPGRSELGSGPVRVVRGVWAAVFVPEQV